MRLAAVSAGLLAALALILLADTTPLSAQPQPRPDDDVDSQRVWTHYIPGLASYDAIDRQRNRDRLVRLGQAAVPHLAAALTSSSLIDRLHEARQLPTLRAVVAADLDGWLARNTERFVNFPRIARLVDTYRRTVASNDGLRDGLRRIAGQMDELGDTAPRPEVLNTLRASAALALGEIGETTHVDAIGGLLTDGSREVQAHAIRALGLLRASGYAERVEPFLFVDDVFTRSCAWAALRRMDSRRSVTMLIDELAAVADEANGGGADPAVTARRERIVQALEGMTMQRLGGNVGLWRRWWDNARTGDNPLQLPQLPAAAGR